MPTDVKTALRRLLAELEEGDALEELEELKRQLAEGRRVTFADIRTALEELEGDEREEALAWLRELARDPSAPPPAPAPPEPPQPPPPAPDPPPSPPEPTRRTRPGRRSGRAYDWEPDPETGEPRRLSVARVYNGPDEPDEVELLEPGSDDDGGGE